MRFFYVVLAMFLFSTPAIAESSVLLMTEEFPPYQYYNKDGGALTGISLEIVQAIQKKIGNTDPIKVYPWSRGLKLLKKHKNAALFSTTRTPAREDKYKWVGPLSKLEMVFFKKAGSDITLTSLEDAKKVEKIGVTKNVATHEILLNQGFKNLDVMQSGQDDKNLKRLIKGRIDLWPTVYYAGIYSAKKMGILDQIEVIPNVTILSGFLYIAFNKEADNKVIHKWQLALDQLMSSGEIDRIMKKYDK